jgi:hypothetical protein
MRRVLTNMQSIAGWTVRGDGRGGGPSGGGGGGGQPCPQGRQKGGRGALPVHRREPGRGSGDPANQVGGAW